MQRIGRAMRQARRRHDKARRIALGCRLLGQYRRMFAAADKLLAKRRLDIRQYPGDPMALFRITTRRRANMAMRAAARYGRKHQDSQTAFYLIDTLLGIRYRNAT